MTPREGAMTEGKPTTCNHKFPFLVKGCPTCEQLRTLLGKQAAVKERHELAANECMSHVTIGQYTSSADFEAKWRKLRDRMAEVIARHEPPAALAPEVAVNQELKEASEWHVELAKVTGLGHEITPAEASDYIAEAHNVVCDLREQLTELKEALRELIPVVKVFAQHMTHEQFLALRRAERALSEEETKA